MTETKKILQPRINPEFPDYLIYPDGRIQSIQKKRFNYKANTMVDNFRYLQFVKIRKHPKWQLKFCGINNKHGKTTTVFIHKIVAQTFLKQIPGKNNVWFKDDDKNNCSAANLFFVNQGDLNHIQVRLGKRDMLKQAEIMRQKRGSLKGNGRKPGGKVINGKYVLPVTKKLEN